MERLRQDILEGRLGAGEWLRQERLAQDYGVSHMPVREALKQLAAEGLVEHVPYRGVRVLQFSEDDVEDLYASRVFLEGRAAFFAARRISAADLRKLREIQERMATPSGFPVPLNESRELNFRFHELMYQACERPFLIRMLAQIWHAFPRMLWPSLRETASGAAPGREDRDSREHETILRALEARNPEEAERAVREHIEAARCEFLEIMRHRAKE
jgi:DNA-binding GntR family transcriptional regulator